MRPDFADFRLRRERPGSTVAGRTNTLMRSSAIALMCALALVSVPCLAQTQAPKGKIASSLVQHAADHPNAEVVVHLLFGTSAARQAVAEMDNFGLRRPSRRGASDILQDAEQRRVELRARIE